MASITNDFIQRLASVNKDLNKIKSEQLDSKFHRNLLRSLVEEYFNSVRTSLLNDSNSTIDSEISILDSTMQELLTICHKRGRTAHYIKLLSNIKKSLINVESKLIALPVSAKIVPKNNSIDIEIIESLKSLIPTASNSYSQALNDLREQSRESWRGTATDLREALRETLDYLAPDAEVKAMPGYTQSKDTSGPTMKQKVWFVLKKRGLSSAKGEPATNATESIESSYGTLVRSVYTRSSISTHSLTDKTEVTRIRDLVRVILCELLSIQT